MKFKTFCDKNKYIFGTVTLIIISIMLSIFVFSGAYTDLANAAKLSWEYLMHIFKFSDGTSPSPLPSIPGTPGNGGGIVLLPENSAILVAKLKVWGLLYINGATYSKFFANLFVWLTNAMTILMIIIPLYLIAKKLVVLLYMRPNTRHGIDTLPLKAYKKVSKVAITPPIDYVKGLIKYIKEDCKVEKFILIIIWLLNLNVISIILPLIPFYLYFCFTFDFVALYEILKYTIVNTKYIAMLSPFVLVPIVLLILDKGRQEIALNRLRGFEEYNQEMLKSRDISTYKWGTMGTRKTMTLTDEALSISVMDTKKAEEDMYICRSMFPKFQWLLFEMDIEKNIKSERLYSWATCIDYVAEIESLHQEDKHDLFGYREKTLNYYNGLVVNNLFKVLADYARLYFLYVCQSSFIISNYAIREDKVPMTVGNTIRWDCDFFNFEKDFETSSYYSKILDFDLLRMGRKLYNDPTKNSLEFGVICIAEADKEQMNAVETIADSTESPYPNPKNDGITLTEKLIRHRATIMGYCYAHILKDGQRYMSINADTRELSTLEHMLKPSKEKNALPFFTIEKTICGKIDEFYKKFEEKIRYYRGDNTLLHYFLSFIHKKAFDLLSRRKNRYGYVIISIALDEGTLDGKSKVIKKYQCNAKTLSDRYRTDSSSKFFEENSRQSGTGIVKYPSYGSTTMTDTEFSKQGSYVRLKMSNPDWKKPYIDKANAEKEEQKAIAKAKAKKKAKEIDKEQSNENTNNRN